MGFTFIFENFDIALEVSEHVECVCVSTYVHGLMHYIMCACLQMYFLSVCTCMMYMPHVHVRVHVNCYTQVYEHVCACVHLCTYVSIHMYICTYV